MTKKRAIKSYQLLVDGEELDLKMYPISTILRALQMYAEEYKGIVGALPGSKTVQEIVEEMIK